MHLRLARGRTPTLTINGTPLTFATQATPYAGFTVTASGGSGGYVFSLAPTSGPLPTPMTINSATGSPTGTPATAGAFTGIVIRVTDSFGHTADLAAFSITVSAASPGLTITDPVANSSPYTASFAPVFQDTYVAMTPLVAQNDEAIDVQGVIGVPYSPMATAITFSGTDLTWFDKIAGGKLIFKAASRASVPRNQYLTLTVNASNANGPSVQCTLYVWVPADADCIFVSFGTGIDASPAGDGSLAKPWKHCPGTQDYTGTQGAYVSGQTIFFEGVDGGVRHETALLQSNSAPWAAPPHHGGAGTPFHYAFTGWKGQAKFSGARSEAGTWNAAVNADVYSNGNTANCTVLTAGSTVRPDQPIYWGDTMGRVAQYPRPNNLRKNEIALTAAQGTNSYNDAAGTSDGGMKRATLTSNASDPAAVHLYASPTGVDCWVQDAKLDVRFNNSTTVAGQRLKLWTSGNSISYVNVKSYDPATHRAKFDFGSGGTIFFSSDSSYTAYALFNSPYDVLVATQYYTFGTKVVAQRPASPGQAYISRLDIGSGFGQQPNVMHHQAWFERYASATDQACGAMRAYNTGNQTGISVWGCRIHQMNSELEQYLGFFASGGSGLDNPILNRFHYSENVRGAGSQASLAQISGKMTGSGPGGYPTKAEVAAWPTGKFFDWYFEEDSITRSAILFTQARGTEWRGLCVRNFSTVHGDVFPDPYLFADGYGLYYDHNYHHHNFGDNVCRWNTTSITDGIIATAATMTGGFSNWYDGDLVLGDTQGSNVGVTLFAGNPGAIYSGGVYLQSANSTNTSNQPCMSINQGFVNMTIQYSILDGITRTTTPSGAGTPATHTIDHCGNTGAAFPADDAANGRRFTNTTTLSTQYTWDGVTIPSSWKPILQGSGLTRLGPFLSNS